MPNNPKKLKFRALIIVLTVLIFVLFSSYAMVLAGLFTPGGQGAQITDLEKGLLAHYSLAQDSLKSSTVIADLTPNGNNGTITAGASLGFQPDQRGVANRAYDFDGANTTIVTNWTSNSEFQNGFTISAWIKPDNAGENSYGRIIDKSNDTGPTTGFGYYLFTNNTIGFKANGAGGGTTIASANNSITYGIWQHVLVTVASNATVTHYINGVLSGTSAATGALSGITTSNPLTIGNRSTATDRTFDGRISDLRIYNKVLNSDEVYNLYQSYNPNLTINSLDAGLVGHWTLDKNDLKSSTVIADKTPYRNDGTIVGATFTTDRKGVANKAMSFNGTTDYVTLPASNALIPNPATVTMSGWFKATSAITQRYLVSTQRTAGGSYLSVRYDVTKLGWVYPSGATVAVGVGTKAINDGNWHHFIFVKNGTVNTGYIDGIQDFTATAAYTITPSANVGNIGSLNNNTITYIFAGSISDVRIYNRALSAEEITQLYQSYNPSIVIPSTEKGLIGYFPLSQESLKASNIVADYTPYNRQGTITAGASAGFQPDQRGVANRAYDFDGANTMIDTGSDWIGTSALTISTWIYLDSWGEATGGRIIGNGVTFFRVVLENPSQCALTFTSNLFGSDAYSAVNSLSLNNWYHVVVTRTSAGTANFYINGALSGTANQSSGTPVAGTVNVIIGNRLAQDRTFDGRISDLRVYNRVLSLPEIQQLYQSYR